ncbi:MAG TPA: DUF5627 domain-containing protein [Paludibacter sp.]|jgi:hypothetical protein|nr:DUF5627 domain-containing protein [Paludibacter sp.]
MKQIKLVTILTVGVLSMLISSCENQEVDFPDFDYSTVYFAYQYPVRTIVLGEDTYDTSLDNQHKFEIYATMGGVYANKKRVAIDFVVDNSLTNKLFFSVGDPVKPMPADYYTLAGNQIVLDKSLQGAVGVQLSDAFFADPNSLKNSYVVPLRMTKVVNADSILSGRGSVDDPVRTNPADWEVNALPKDYVLYCVKFINQYHANYLRRGVDQITRDGTTSTVVRHKQHVENDELSKLTTASLTSNEYIVSVLKADDTYEDCNLLLTFDTSNKITVSATTAGYVAAGTGSFVPKGEKKSWGNKDRDVVYLDYTITAASGISYATKDTLVARDRGVSIETFNPSYIK